MKIIVGGSNIDHCTWTAGMCIEKTSLPKTNLSKYTVNKLCGIQQAIVFLLGFVNCSRRASWQWKEAGREMDACRDRSRRAYDVERGRYDHPAGRPQLEVERIRWSGVDIVVGLIYTWFGSRDGWFHPRRCLRSQLWWHDPDNPNVDEQCQIYCPLTAFPHSLASRFWFLYSQ